MIASRLRRLASAAEAANLDGLLVLWQPSASEK
jgi:hypothetical protein